MEPLSRDEIGAVFALVADDLKRAEEIILESSSAADPFLSETTTYLTAAGGKRLRPALTYLGALLAGGPNRAVDLAAAAIEMTHLATLYHDDVIDEADLRRGVPSANSKWDNSVAILAGDFLFARASSLIFQAGGDSPGILANAISEVVQGQLIELQSVYDVTRSRDHYLRTIRGKTSSLLEASIRIGVLLAGGDEELVKAAMVYGDSFGTAFQIADDLLDLVGDEEDLGKAPGTDLKDGVYTLPVIVAVENEPTIAQNLGTPDVDVEGVRSAILAAGGFSEAMHIARASSERAAGAISDGGPASDALSDLSRLMVSRVPVPQG